MVAIVTGASSGIGRAIAIALAGDGYTVILVGRDTKKLKEVQAKLKKEFPKQKFYIASVLLEKYTNIERFLNDTDIPVKESTVLVNCAGTSLGGNVLSASKTEWDHNIAVNLSAPFFLTQAIVRAMVDNRAKGSIVNIASLAGVVGAKKPGYAASKAGLIGLTKSIAQEVGQFGIRVNAIVPGAVDTEFIADWNADNRQTIINKTPLGRIASPEEIAAIVSFLVSGNASFLTGVVINATGGQYLGS